MLDGYDETFIVNVQIKPFGDQVKYRSAQFSTFLQCGSWDLCPVTIAEAEWRNILLICWPLL